jgi:aminomethyltransferase
VTVAESVRAVRAGAGLFRLDERAVIEVRGGDRLRFLQGQLSNDVAALEPDGPRVGCPALALTPQGRIVAEVLLVARPDVFWLDTDRTTVEPLVARLDRYVIADDVQIADASARFARLAVEGPAARAVMAAAAGSALAPGAGGPLEIAGAAVVAVPFGWSGEDALQLFLPAPAVEAVGTALRQAGARPADAETLEVLRVEAGRPRAGAELTQEVLPAEARLVESAVSFTKGCYTGQEVVARMHSRARVGHLLVGVRLEDAGAALPPRGAPLVHDGSPVGAVTSAARSPTAGPVALGFVRAAHAEPGTALRVGERPGRVVELPFVGPSA